MRAVLEGAAPDLCWITEIDHRRFAGLFREASDVGCWQSGDQMIWVAVIPATRDASVIVWIEGQCEPEDVERTLSESTGWSSIGGFAPKTLPSIAWASGR